MRRKLHLNVPRSISNDLYILFRVILKVECLVRINEIRKKFKKVSSANMSYDDLSDACNQLFFDLDNNPATRLLLEQFYPFIRYFFSVYLSVDDNKVVN